ncbi:hypothetical protein MMC22_000464 [Lobaria immixta]|nr:hypothetical protein [Lobaria immixta]
MHPLRIIQGTADATKAFTQAELAKTIHYLSTALRPAFNPGSEEGLDPADPNAVQQTSHVEAEDIEAMEAPT